MIRFVSLFGLLACHAPVPEDYDWNADVVEYPGQLLRVDAQSMEFNLNGTMAYAAMANKACEVNTNSGRIFSDDDPDEGEEDVQDSQDDDMVVVGDHAVYVRTPIGDHQSSYVTLPGEHYIQGRLWDRGVVSLSSDAGACEVVWHEQDLAVDVGSCGTYSGLAVDRLRGTAYVGTGLDLLVADGGGARSTRLAVDLLAWADDERTLFAAAWGGEQLVALDAEAAPLWTLELPGRALDLEVSDALGRVGLLLDAGDRTLVVAYDTRTREELYRVRVDPEAFDLELGPDQRIGLLLPAELRIIRGDEI